MTDTQREFNIDDYEPVVEALSNIFTSREYARTFVSEAIDMSMSIHPEGFTKLDIASSFNLMTVVIESLFPSSFARKYFSFKTSILMIVANLQMSSNVIKKSIADLKLTLDKIDREISIRAESVKEKGLAKTVEASKNTARQLIDSERIENNQQTYDSISEEIANMEHAFENNLTIIVFWKNILTTIDNYFQGIYHNSDIFDNAIFFEHTLEELVLNMSGEIQRHNDATDNSISINKRPTPVSSQIS